MEKSTRIGIVVSASVLAALLIVPLALFAGVGLHMLRGIAASEDQLPREEIVALAEENRLLLEDAVAELAAMMHGLAYGSVSTSEKSPVPENAGKIKGLYRFDQENRYRPLENETLGKAMALEGLLSISYHADGERFDYADFYCGGSGVLDSTTAVGFYYSPDDLPRNLMGEDDLTPCGPGRYEWQEERTPAKQGRNSYETERILPHWYLYEISYQ